MDKYVCLHYLFAYYEMKLAVLCYLLEEDIILSYCQLLTNHFPPTIGLFAYKIVMQICVRFVIMLTILCALMVKRTEINAKVSDGAQ